MLTERPDLQSNLSDVAKKNRPIRRAGLVIVVIALITIFLTFLVLMGITPIEPSRDVVLTAMGINGILVAVLLVAIFLEVKSLVVARRKGRAAARLHVRFVTLFSLMAAVPAILVAVVAMITLDRGLDRWFEERTRKIVDNSMVVAQAYLQEHARVLRGDLIAMSNDVDRAKAVYDFEPTRFDRFFQSQTSLRALLAAFIMRADGTVLTRVELDPESHVLMPPPEAFSQAQSGEPVLIAPGISNLVGGVIKLSAYDDLYLYVTRAMDKRVVDYMRLSEEGTRQYSEMEQSRFGVQIAFALIYTGVALVLLLSSIWLGFGFANRLVAPIRRLISAADQVSKGNYYVEVSTDKSAGDLINLANTFNNMTSQLRSQRDALLAANDQNDRRRRFTEAVLAGVTAGVIGVDDTGMITLANTSARTLIDPDGEDLVDRRLEEVVPELAGLLGPVAAGGERKLREEQISLVRDGRERTVTVRVTSEHSTRREHGYVVTLDDITDLVSAQRTSAWADVARRIAHEIKNPLTPIQLSAERIRRRYGKKIGDDREVFDQCVDTIIRQVGDIGRMVDEFSSFARMPKPAMRDNDLRNTVREAAFLQSVGHPEIEIETHVPSEPANAMFDSRLFGQALTNVIKNAAEAIDAVDGEVDWKGRINVTLRTENNRQVIEVTDNGVGLPSENRQRLLEPYMTTRDKGTGLGLAIVRKILEDHGGEIELLDAPSVAHGGHGAMVRLTLNASNAGLIKNKNTSVGLVDEKVVLSDGA